MKQIENLYLKYKRDIYQYLLSITHDPSLSEDLLSETFVRAIYSIGNFKGNSSIKTWLFSIARHVWLQNLCKNKPVAEYSDFLELYVADSTMDIIITKQLENRIMELLDLKDEKTKSIIGMRISGISYSEISEKISISENSARVIDFRTKNWLKSILKKEGFI
jgi:RNA polymerase sigma factor (sigma-70 family)